jgi:hypothetical protein
MVMTVNQSIPMNSRGFFLRERDSLLDQYGVELKFPRGREFMHGDHQTMLMIGLQSKITSMMPKVRTILTEAQNQYLGYKERQARRREMRPTLTPEPSKKKSKEVPKKTTNLFSALDGLFEQESVNEKIAYEKTLVDKAMNDAITQGLVPRPIKGNVSTMDFATAASKPAASKPAASKPAASKPTASKPAAYFDWGDDVADDVEDGETWVPGTA